MSKWFIRGCSVAFFIIGLALPWWPVLVFAPLLAALYGQWLLAFVFAVFIDLLFGTPLGFLHIFIFPCTAAVLFITAVRSVMIRYLRSYSL